jgi:signal recognition particle GTPase
MFEDLSEKLEATFSRLRGRGTLSESDIKEGSAKCGEFSSKRTSILR